MSVLTREERDHFVAEIDRLGFADGPDRDTVRERLEEHEEEYRTRLPCVTMSRCPFTGELLMKAFDPWGLDGPWWQELRQRKWNEPESPRTFQLLRGAVHLNDLPPRGGIEDAHVRPAVPYVIPRILNMPGMIAVVSAIPMECGYTAYPIAYFAIMPPEPGSFADGGFGWATPAEPWDVDLKPWIEQNKLKWIEPGDDHFEVKGLFWSRYPFRDLQGRT